MGRGLLFLTGGMFVVVGIIQMGINNRQQILPQRTIEYHSEHQAKNITASLMDYALQEIRKDQNWKGGFQADNFLGGSGNLTVYDFNDFLDPDVDIPANNVPLWNQFTLLLLATSTYEQQSIETEVVLTKDSFSRFSYFTDFEPSNIYFIWLDELSGPVHSNGRINIAGDPTFHGMVTSTQDWHGNSNFVNDPQFLGGSDFSVDPKPMPTDDQLNVLRFSAQNGGLKYNNEIRITLNSDGTATILENVTGNWNQAVEQIITLSNYNGVISSSEDVYIKGVLNGQLTVHSEEDINITGDLTYNTDPRDVVNSSDLLGLVSEKQVIIDKNAHQDNGFLDLAIHASIMALDKSFTVEDYTKGSPKGELNLLGGLIQQRRGPVGTFSGGGIKSGYSKNYEYDERLLNMHPPSFPRESFFSIRYWTDRLVN